MTTPDAARKARNAAAIKAAKAPAKGKVRSVGGKRADLGNRFFRSRWEANYARYLNWLLANGDIAKWEYEPELFIFHGEIRGAITYLPDFRVTELGGKVVYHEVKGWMDAKSKSKLRKMKKFYPEVVILVIGPKEYRDVAKKVGAIIPNWETEKKK